MNGIAAEVPHRPYLQPASEAGASLIPSKRICTPTNGPSAVAREQAFGSDLRAMGDPQPMNRLINWTLTDLMLQHSEVVMMGEDIGRKGGAYGITQKLLQGFGSGTDLAIVTYGNGRCLSSQAQAKLEAKGGNTRIIDLRWLAPLPIEAVLEATKGCNHVLIVDECRSTGSRSEALMALFAERSKVATACHVAGDCFIATGPAYAASLPSKDSIISAALALVQVDG